MYEEHFSYCTSQVNTFTSAFETLTYEKDLKRWLKDYDEEVTFKAAAYSLAEWEWETDITDRKQKRKIRAGLDFENFISAKAKEAQQKFDTTKLKDAKLKRMLNKVLAYLNEGTLAERERLAEIASKLSTRYGTGKICPTNLSEPCSDPEKLSLDPHLVEIFQNSRDEKKLRIAWKRWRDLTGKPAKKQFFQYVKNVTSLVQKSGYKSLTEHWLRGYETEASIFQNDLLQLFKEILPFYEDLHAYIRHRLGQVYGSEVVGSRGAIPAHLFGDMWAQQWGNIFYIVQPYRGKIGDLKEGMSLTETMQRQQYTIWTMFDAAENFFKSLGLPGLPKHFYHNSMLEKPMDGTDVVCHGSAHDLNKRDDFRVKMCTKVNSVDFGTVHHELGHIYYYMAYKDQPWVFRNGANPGFHEAIGDTIYLSAMQDQYLKHMGLLPKNHTRSYKNIINDQMKKALEIIGFVPFGYLVDLWRWDIFAGQVSEKASNDHWWQLREKYQGVNAPIPRGPEDFDPASKYHVANFIPYIRYFVARILQFEFHESLCKAAGQGNDLSACSIFGSKDAGEKLWSAMQLGSSRPWPEVHRRLTGSDRMSAQPLLKYFDKLRNWLREENQMNGSCLGWGAEWPEDFKLHGPRCSSGSRTLATFSMSFVFLCKFFV